MSGDSIHSSTLQELEELLNDTDFCQMFTTTKPNENQLENINESSSSTVVTTPDPLNMAFINDTAIIDDEHHNQISLSQQQRQTVNDTSLVIHSLINKITQEECETINLHSSTPIMISIGTMPRTPTTKSIGTIPRTPTTMISIGTMPKTPITMISQGTMPRTPITMISQGTMPRTPTTMISQGTMSRTSVSSPMSVNEIIDFYSSIPSTIDLVSPTVETIDLCSPDDIPTHSDRSN